MWIAGLAALQQAVPPPPHAVQPRSPLGRDRHGLHEPEPVGARRPRVRLHGDADGPRAEDRRRALDASRSCASGSAPGPARRAAGTRRRRLTVARFGDNMRQVAVTEGDKVEAQLRLGVTVNGYGVGDLVEAVRCRLGRRGRPPRRRVRGRATTSLPRSGRAASGASRSATPRGSRPGCASFLERLGARAFTDTFEDLHGLDAASRASPSSG